MNPKSIEDTGCERRRQEGSIRDIEVSPVVHSLQGKRRDGIEGCKRSDWFELGGSIQSDLFKGVM